MTQPNQVLLQKLLTDDFQERRHRNSAFSVRAYSKKLGINHSALSEIMSGKRVIGKKIAERIIAGLDLAPDMAAKIFVQQKLTGSLKARQALMLQADQFKVISDWYHFAILSMAETEDFVSDDAWIAKRLGLSVSTVTNAIQRLERLKMLRRNSEGAILPAGQSFDTTDGIRNSALRHTHHQYLDIAKQALDGENLERRYFSGMTMAIDPQKIPEAQKRIRHFRDQLCEYLESGNKKEVYQICIQLFSLEQGDSQ